MGPGCQTMQLERIHLMGVVAVRVIVGESVACDVEMDPSIWQRSPKSTGRSAIVLFRVGLDGQQATYMGNQLGGNMAGALAGGRESFGASRSLGAGCKSRPALPTLFSLGADQRGQVVGIAGGERGCRAAGLRG